MRITALHTTNKSIKDICKIPASEVNNLEPVLFLAKGAPVICTYNYFKRAGLINGACGVVHDIIYAPDKTPNTHMPIAILVQFPDTIYRGPSFLRHVPKIVKFVPVTESFIIDGTKCTRTQFPLTLAFATTIHKSQGLTISRCLGNLGNSEYQVGLLYVLLSRLRELKNLKFDPFSTKYRFLVPQKSSSSQGA